MKTKDKAKAWTQAILWAILILPFFTACNNEDDIFGILTGKTWKLSRLTEEGSSERFLRFWDNEADYNNSMTALGSEGNFTLTFTGNGMNGEDGGNFTAKGIRATAEGTWRADGRSRELTLHITSIQTQENDVLAKEFINNLQNISRYEGDDRSLTLFYESGSITKVMGFKPQR